MGHDQDPGPDTLSDLLRRAANAIPDDGMDLSRVAAIRFGLAEALRAAGDPDTADLELGKLLSAQPKHAPAWHARIDIALSAGRNREAGGLAKEALAHLPKDLSILVRQCRALTAMRRHADAARILARLRERAPDDLGIAVQHADALRASGDLPGADRAFLEILSTAPRNLAAIRGRIDVALGQDMPEVAIRRCEAALKQHPGNESIRNRYAVALPKAGRSREAATLLRAWLEDSPESLDLKRRLAQILRGLGDFDESDALLSDILQQRPLDTAALLGRIDGMKTAGDPDRALALCDEFVERHGATPFVLRRQAALLKQIGRTQDAVTVLTGLVDANPKDTLARLDLGYAHLANGALDDADRLFAGILKTQPDEQRALLGRVEVAEARGEPAAALALLEGRLGPPPAGS